MKELDELRREIDRIDADMARLFEARMVAVREISEYKSAHGAAITDASREAEIMHNADSRITDSSLLPYYREFLRTEMAVSRRYQAELRADGNTIFVAAEHGTYPVIIGKDILSTADVIPTNARALVVTDAGVPREYAEAVAKLLNNSVTVTLDEGEKSKSFGTLEMLCKKMLALGFTRHDCVIAVGGGVVCDIAGLAASLYMRGIRHYAYPTTLLAAVDASVGGKTALNIDRIKNIIGTFSQPEAVIIDTDTFKTLPTRQFANGMAEAIKTAACLDKDLFDKIADGTAQDDIAALIHRCVILKARIVAEDEYDNSVRRVLNFGHTLGHAIESASHGRYLHGEAVALGMLPMCSYEVRDKLYNVLDKYGLPTECGLCSDDVLDALYYDKKTCGDTVAAVYCNEIGTYTFNDMTRDELIDLYEETFIK